MVNLEQPIAEAIFGTVFSVMPPWVWVLTICAGIFSLILFVRMRAGVKVTMFASWLSMTGTTIFFFWALH